MRRPPRIGRALFFVALTALGTAWLLHKGETHRATEALAHRFAPKYGEGCVVAVFADGEGRTLRCRIGGLEVGNVMTHAERDHTDVFVGTVVLDPARMAVPFVLDAYALDGRRVGATHRLKISYPSDRFGAPGQGAATIPGGASVPLVLAIRPAAPKE